jgi:hypothetical protein
MQFFKTLAVSALVTCSLAAAGKDKKKVLLPADVLQAETVLVVIDPDAGVAMDAPMANRTAQEDVEKALMNWGRFNLAMEASNADLIISIRKGNGKIAQPTVGGVPTNNRPVVLEPTGTGGRIGGRTGNPPTIGDPTDSQSQNPHPQIEVGEAQDTFAVYRGKRENPLDAPPVWRYTAKDALRSPSVPAVDAFRKLIAEAEKQQAATP